MKESNYGLTSTRDILGRTDRDLTRHIVQPPAVIIRPARNEQVIWEVRSTPSHKPGVNDGKK